MMDNKNLDLIPDYTFDKYWANVLKQKIQEYYKTIGNTNVKVWLEMQKTADGRKFWNVRSNIVCDFTQ